MLCGEKNTLHRVLYYNIITFNDALEDQEGDRLSHYDTNRGQHFTFLP